jgi:hypothetical protein
VALAFGERGGAAPARRLARLDPWLSSNLLEAELRAACARERVTPSMELFQGIKWVLPDRPLTVELKSVFAQGYARGGDAWHLACALYLARDPRELVFLTLDHRQRALARRLGFVT